MRVLSINGDGAIAFYNIKMSKAEDLKNFLCTDEVAFAQISEEYYMYYDSFAKYKGFPHSITWYGTKIYGRVIFQRRDRDNISERDAEKILNDEYIEVV